MSGLRAPGVQRRRKPLLPCRLPFKEKSLSPFQHLTKITVAHAAAGLCRSSHGRPWIGSLVQEHERMKHSLEEIRHWISAVSEDSGASTRKTRRCGPRWTG